MKILFVTKAANELTDGSGFTSDFIQKLASEVNSREEFYAEIKRSTNGGGENSPDLDFQNDEYSIFMMRLSDL